MEEFQYSLLQNFQQNSNLFDWTPFITDPRGYLLIIVLTV